MIANRKLWVEALRSGEYKQTTGYLNKGDGYCCLGVACEIYQREVGDLVIRDCLDNGVKSYDGDVNFLPQKVADWLGLATRDGSFEDGSLEGDKLAYLNDNGASFEEIADVIESKS